MCSVCVSQGPAGPPGPKGSRGGAGSPVSIGSHTLYIHPPLQHNNKISKSNAITTKHPRWNVVGSLCSSSACVGCYWLPRSRWKNGTPRPLCESQSSVLPPPDPLTTTRLQDCSKNVASRNVAFTWTRSLTFFNREHPDPPDPLDQEARKDRREVAVRPVPPVAPVRLEELEA